MLDNFEFILIQPIHYDEVIVHLRDNFFFDEPLNQAVNLCAKGEGHKELEKHSLSTLADGVSIAVVNSKGEIVGVCLNGFLHPGDTQQAKDDLQFSDDENFKLIFNLLYDENLKVDLFARFQADRIFEYRILSVDAKCRGQGLAKKLLMKSEEQAKKYHCKITSTCATGIFSQKISMSLGMTPAAEIKYSDTNLKVNSPHDKLIILYKNLYE